jgi:hypothetical protein
VSEGVRESESEEVKKSEKVSEREERKGKGGE